MDAVTGSCRFGLWFVEVSISGFLVTRVRFTRAGQPGPVPQAFIRFLAGKGKDFTPLTSLALTPGYPYERIYRIVADIPYGTTITYGEVAGHAGTVPRVVGLAMKHNPTPLIIPCHRVVAKEGIGGFTPDPEIKQELIRMENTICMQSGVG